MPSASWISSAAPRTAPVVASTHVCSRLGVPLARTPLARTSQTRRGVPSVASTASVGAALSRETPAGSVGRVAVRAFAALMPGVVETLTGALSVWLTESAAPSAPRCATRSPPRTGSPRYVRSIRTWLAPERSPTAFVATRSSATESRTRPGAARRACSARAPTADTSSLAERTDGVGRAGGRRGDGGGQDC